MDIVLRNVQRAKIASGANTIVVFRKVARIVLVVSIRIMIRLEIVNLIAQIAISIDIQLRMS